MAANTVQLLPPDDEQEQLGKEVNAMLGGDKRISFYRIAKVEGGVAYGVVFQYGSARKSQTQSQPWFDPREIADEVEQWVKGL